MKFLFRFDKPRDSQVDMMKDIYTALSNGKNILMNAPTGIGKTDASLSAAITYAIDNDKDIFFLTPKISQHKIAIDVLKGLRDKFNLNITYVDVVGKKNMCINPEINNISDSSFYNACEALIKKNKCPYFNRIKHYDLDEDKDMIDAFASGHNEIFQQSYKKGLCPYEVSMKFAKKANIVIAGYSHILNPYTKQTFLKKLSRDLSNSIVIWDEAHNIFNSAVSYFSSSLSEVVINRAAAELEAINSDIDISFLSFELSKLASKKLTLEKYESFVDPEDFLADESKLFGDMIPEIEKAGMMYIENMHAKRSALMHIASFLTGWEIGDESTTRIIGRFNGKVELKLSNLYPEKALSVFKEAYSNIFMSGTLIPLDMYKDLFGTINADTKSYKSPFLKGNQFVAIDGEVSTKFSGRNTDLYKAIAKKINKIYESIPGNTSVFFPSFSILDSTYRYLDLSKINSVFIQRGNMSNIEIERIIKNFKVSKKGLMLGVMGGSLSEGINYDNNSIKCVVIVGIPLTKPDLELQARINYMNKKFHNSGNEYVYTIPAVIRAIQAAGRAIRSETDKASIIFMDNRYEWKNYKFLLKNFFTLYEGDDYLSEIAKFWEKNIDVDSDLSHHNI